jgi:hypothetical protein
MQQPELGDPVRPSALRKGDLIFIQHHGKEPELGIFLLGERARVLFHSFSDPINRIYDYYFADGWMPALFRVNPADFKNAQIQEFRESDVFKYLNGPVNDIRYMRQRIGEQFYFEENSRGSLHDFVLGKLVQISVTQVGSYTLTYEGRGRQRYVRRGEIDEKPKIYEYSGPRLRVGPPGNLLGPGGQAVRNRLIAELGPEVGVQRIIEAVPGAAMTRRLPLLIAYKKVLNDRRKAYNEAMAAAAAAGGGGGGAAANNNEATRNNTTRGGRRQRRRRLRRTRRT